MARTRRTGNDSGPFASFAPFAAKDLGWPKGICSMPRRGSLVCSALCALLLLSSPAAPQSRKPKSPLRFRVTLSEQIAPKATSGRLLVLMTDAPQEVQTIRSGFIPGSTWIAATEIEHFAPGAAIELDPDLKAYPKPFSEARPGTYQMMALLDPDHSYAYHGEDGGDLTSAVVKVDHLNTADTQPWIAAHSRGPRALQAGRHRKHQTRWIPESDAYQILGSRYHNARGCCFATGLWQRAEEDIRGRLPHSRFR